MKIDFKDNTLQILIKFIIVELLGYIFVSSSILSTGDIMFSYTIYGLSIILFFHTIKIWGVKDFILPAAVYSVIVIMTFMQVSLVLAFFRNLVFFALLGTVCFLNFKLNSIKDKTVNLIAQFGFWTLGCMAVYLIIGILNVYVFNLYTLSEYETIVTYSLLQLKTGGVLGVSLGIGTVIQNILIDLKK